VGNADCGGNTPCDTGIGALQTAVNALPASGGTIYVYGAHDSSGAAIGTKNITLRPVDSSASLNGACAGSLVELDDSGNLTVNGLAVIGEGDPGTSCFIGVEVTGTGNLTVQNGATFEGWYGDGFYAAYGVSISGGSGTHSISSATFADNATGLNVEAGTTTVSNSVFEANSDGGVMIDGGTLTIENSNLSNNLSYGLFQYAGTVTLRGNAFNGNSYYAFVNGGGTMTAFANNITGNNDGDYQAYIASTATVAKNWWGSFSDPNVGPSDGSSSYADGWDRRLGAPVDSWVAGTNSVVLGDARLSGSGDAVIISFGRGSSSAPFGNGIPPYVNRSCSDYYDFYALDNPTGWTVTLPVDTSTACITNVRNYEVAFTIDPANYDAACSTSNNPACWVRIPENKIVVSGNNLVITGQDLSYTHIVAGDEEGLDPTAVSLQSFGLDSRLLVWPLVMSLLALFGVTFVVVRRRQA